MVLHVAQPKYLLSLFCFFFEIVLSIILAFICYLQKYFHYSSMSAVVYCLAIKNRLLKTYWQNPRGSMWNYLFENLLLKFSRYRLIFLAQYFYYFTCYWVETAVGRYLFCFVTKFYQNCLKVPKHFLLEWYAFKATYHPQEGYSHKGIQMFWVKSKYSASLRKGRALWNLAEVQPVKKTPHFSVDDQEKRSAGLWVWEKGSWAFYWWDKPGKTTLLVLRGGQIRASCERKSERDRDSFLGRT